MKKSIQIEYDPKFVKQLRKLPKTIQLLAVKKETYFRSDQFHPALKTHPLTGTMKGLFSFSVNREYRVIFYFTESDRKTVVFLSVGTHSIYQ